MERAFLGRPVFHIILIALLGLLVYSNTFHAPFQWDDKYLIAGNPVIKNIDYFFEPSEAKGLGEYYSAFKSRYIGYLSFALNYKIHGTDVTGYHIFNISIHILNALLVYLLVLLTFRTPFLSKSLLKEHSNYIALFTGLLFVSHPVQTEAVTYIFQRLASLMSFFYLLSVVAYIKWRLNPPYPPLGKGGFYLLSLISAVLAMKTKENAVTLPIVIMLFEFLFFSGPIRKRMLRLTPLLLTLFIIPLSIVSFDRPVGEIVSGIGYSGISRWDYLFTQFRVIVTYIRLLFLPVNQNIAYDYPVFHSFFNPQVFLSFLFLLSVFCVGTYLLYRSRITHHSLRITTFGLFWFFITLSVESSIIPIPMLIHEYRLYLPSVGAFLAITTGAFLLLERFKNKRIKAFAVLSFVLIPLVFSYATYTRNSVWSSKISLWEDVVRKSFHNPRGHYNLGLSYQESGLIDMAIKHYQIAIRLKPDDIKAHNNLGTVYIDKGLTDKAIEHLQIVLKLKPDFADAHYNLGVTYTAKALFDKAIEHYRTALKLNLHEAKVYYGLGIAYYNKGLIEKALEQYRIALRLKPDYTDVRYNLGIAYQSRGLIEKAIEQYHTILRLRPSHAETHYNLGIIYWSKGITDKAIKHLKIVLKLKPDYAEAHFNLGLVYLEKGLVEKARREFEMALQINPDYHKARQWLNYITNPDKASPHKKHP